MLSDGWWCSTMVDDGRRWLNMVNDSRFTWLPQPQHVQWDPRSALAGCDLEKDLLLKRCWEICDPEKDLLLKRRWEICYLEQDLLLKRSWEICVLKEIYFCRNVEKYVTSRKIYFLIDVEKYAEYRLNVISLLTSRNNCSSGINQYGPWANNGNWGKVFNMYYLMGFKLFNTHKLGFSLYTYQRTFLINTYQWAFLINTYQWAFLINTYQWAFQSTHTNGRSSI